MYRRFDSGPPLYEFVTGTSSEGGSARSGAQPADSLPGAPSAPESRGPTDARFDGTRIWLVTDGTAEAAGWLEPFTGALSALGAGSVDVLGVSGVFEHTARDLLGQGAERVARTLRFARRGQPDASAFDIAAAGRPDLVLVDHPGILRTLDVIRDAARTSAVHVGLISAVVPAEAWGRARADAYVIADPSARPLVQRAEVSDAAVLSAGPPIPAGFARSVDRESARADLQLGDGPVVLVDAAGMAPDLVDAVVASAVGVSGLSMLFHYGSDRGVAEVLRTAAALHGVRASMFGHVDDLEVYAAASDVVVVGPANPLVGAFVAVGTPVASLDPALARSALAAGDAVTVVSRSEISVLLARIAESGVPPEARDAALATVGSDPTADFAAAVASIWTARDKLSRVSAVASETPSAPAGSARRFEPIGGDAPAPDEDTPLSRDKARELLASLILDERRIEGDIAAFASERDRWLTRMSLAEDSGQADLAEFASGQVRGVTARIAAANDQMAAVQRKKDAIRRRAASRPAPLAPPAGDTATGAAPMPDDYEARFRRLERDGELNRLRKKALDE